MHSLHDKKLEIECKLEKEQENLQLLKERISKSSQLTKSVDKILNSFEQRLSRLEETILPVYNETENLQRCQQNIDRTLQALDSVISFYNVSTEVEDVIRKGPGATTEGGVGLDVFLQAMNRLLKAEKYFEENNSQSVELENVTTLFSQGVEGLNKEFKDLLFRHSKPMLPVTLLNIINMEDEFKIEKLQQILSKKIPFKLDVAQYATFKIIITRKMFDKSDI